MQEKSCAWDQPNFQNQNKIAGNRRKKKKVVLVWVTIFFWCILFMETSGIILGYIKMVELRSRWPAINLNHSLCV